MKLQAGSPIGRRLLEACEMHDIGIALLRQRFHRDHPTLTPDEVEGLVRAWVSDRPFDSPGQPTTSFRSLRATATE